MTKIIGKIVRHGVSKHPLYNVWIKIKERCYIEKCKSYKNYGAIGIKMWEGWVNNPKEFVEWGISNGWKQGLQIDKDIISEKLGIPTKLYSPETCCFITPKENNLHKRTNRFVTVGDKTQTLKEWSIELGIKYGCLASRLRRYGSFDKSTKQKKDSKRNTFMYSYNGRSQSLPKWAIELGMSYKFLHARVHKDKMSIDAAFTTPKNFNRDNIHYNNKVKNLTQWAKELNIKQVTLYRRLYVVGMTVENAFNIPVRKKQNK